MANYQNNSEIILFLSPMAGVRRPMTIEQNTLLTSGCRLLTTGFITISN